MVDSQYDELRRIRLTNVAAGIPAVLWYVVAIGALIAILLVSLFDMQLHVHLLLRGLSSLSLGMMIFLVAALGHPFRRELNVSPDAFQSVYNSLRARLRMRYAESEAPLGAARRGFSSTGAERPRVAVSTGVQKSRVG